MADGCRRPRNSIQRTRVAEEVPAFAHERRRHAERVVVDPELAQTLQRLGLLHVGWQLNLRVAGVDATEKALAGHDLVVQQLHVVHHVRAAALGRDGLAARGFVLSGDVADLRSHFVHGSFENELTASVGKVSFGDAGLYLGIVLCEGLCEGLWAGLGHGNVMLGRRCDSGCLDKHRWCIDRGKDPIS